MSTSLIRDRYVIARAGGPAPEVIEDGAVV